MNLEDRLSGWTGPSSPTEKEKQERAERMVRQAVNAHKPFEGFDFRVYAKGSYANNTNVRSDSNVDIAVRCTAACYWEEHTKGAAPASSSYGGIWTASKLRNELVAAMKAKFPNQVDTSGSTAIRVNANSARVDADVVPCFDYHYYFSPTSYREGAMIIKKDGTRISNYSEEQLKKGRAKNTATNGFFKQAVRIMKRVENAMVQDDYHREVQSYFVECLVYNVPDEVLKRSTWESTIRGVIYHIYSSLQGDERSEASHRWHEVSEWKYLFHNSQPWTRKDARDFAMAAWNYLDLGE
jgi:hypothetical protein